MSLSRALRLLAIRRELNRSLKARRIARHFKSESAHRGVHTEITRRAAQARAMFQVAN